MAADVQSEYGPTWYSRKAALPEPRASLNFDLDVDVCVIGGGLAGLTVAREVVRRGWSVAVLEACRIAGNASGRNSGFVSPGYAARTDKILERIGLPATRALWDLSQAGVEYVRDAIAELGIPAEGRGWLDVWKRPDAGAVAARVALLGQDLGADVEMWSTERVRGMLNSSQYFQALHFPRAFQIDPLAYALRLAEAAELAGAYLFEHTPALSIDPAGVRKRIVTPKGRVRAGRVVMAANIGLGAVAQRISDTLVPVTAYTGVTKPLGENLAQAISFPGAVSASRHADYHYRVVGGDRLMWTGAASLRPRDPKRMARRFARAIRTAFPQLGPVAFESFWSGDMGFAIHRMPQIGEVQPGIWLASAFGAQGLNTSAMAGQLLARAIVEGDDTWRMFTPFELVWSGGAAGRAMVRATTWWWQASEAIVDRVARRREERRERRRRAAAGLPPAAPRPAYRAVPVSAFDSGRALARTDEDAAIGAHDAPIAAVASADPVVLPDQPEPAALEAAVAPDAAAPGPNGPRDAP